jgi:drug/metabolite transporter (DMT)-like permease
MTSLAGPALVLVFGLTQAFRSVYFGHLFQSIPFFAVVFIAFFISTALFTVLTALRSPGEFAILRKHPGPVIAMNVTTAIAWNCNFFALTHLEPSVVSTLHTGIAPLVVVGLGVFGVRLAGKGQPEPMELACYGGIAASLAALWWVVLSDNSGIAVTHWPLALTSLAALLVSGTSITLSQLYTKRLHDHGVGAEAVTAARYPLVTVVAGIAILVSGGNTGIHGAGQLSFLVVALTILVVLPTFSLQAGIQRTGRLTAQVIRALGPVLVFGLEQIDHRITYSGPTLACILAYCAFVVGANLAHGWGGARFAVRRRRTSVR